MLIHFRVFADYDGHNILATQRLLEAAKAVGVKRLVYASSSSVYGNAPAYPTTEDDLPRPHSPYGVTKLAAEHLCGLYAENWDVYTVSLRYFTVFGPRQRPDMSIHRLCEAAVRGTTFPRYGDGTQIREYRCCLPKFSVLSTPEFQTVGFPLAIQCDSHLLKAAADGAFRGRIPASFRELGHAMLDHNRGANVHCDRLP